jgi:hypothetical protein
MRTAFAQKMIIFDGQFAEPQKPDKRLVVGKFAQKAKTRQN